MEQKHRAGVGVIPEVQKWRLVQRGGTFMKREYYCFYKEKKKEKKKRQTPTPIEFAICPACFQMQEKVRNPAWFHMQGSLRST